MSQVKQVVVGYRDRAGRNRQKTMFFNDERLFDWAVSEVRSNPLFMLIDAGSVRHMTDRLAVENALKLFEADCG